MSEDHADTLYIVIPGQPVPAPRPKFRVIPRKKLPEIRKFARAGSMKGLMGCFMPIPYVEETDRYKAWKRDAAWAMEAVRLAYCGKKPFVQKGVPIEVHLLFVMPLAQSHHRKRTPRIREWCAKLRGDPDNLSKGPLDAANGIIWHDDAQVASLTIERITGAQDEPGRTEMMVWSLEQRDCERTGFERIRQTIRSLGRLFGSTKNQEDDKCRKEQTGLLPF